MMGYKGREQLDLFVAGSLEQLIPEDHILRQVDRVLDLSWLREEVAECYCAERGRPGLDPEAVVRLMLAAFGCEPVAERVVVDGNVITGGGVTAGIDFALTVAGELLGPEAARKIQLGMEYDPQPPFDSGSPERADPAMVAAVQEGAAARQNEREAAVKEAAGRL